PVADPTGSPYSISVMAGDSCGSDSKTLQLTVTPAAPVIDPIAPASIGCGVPFTTTPTATGGGLTWSLGGSPPRQTINSSTGQISWLTPDISCSPYTIDVNVSSFFGSDSKQLVLSVIQADLNGDGVVSALDIPFFVDELLGITPPNLCAADLNNDGNV